MTCTSVIVSCESTSPARGRVHRYKYQWDHSQAANASREKDGTVTISVTALPALVEARGNAVPERYGAVVASILVPPALGEAQNALIRLMISCRIRRH